MEDSKIARPAKQWELRGYKKKPGRPRKNWMDIVRWDMKDTDTTRDEAEQLATDRAEWRQRVAQCFHQAAGWTIYKVETTELIFSSLFSVVHICIGYILCGTLLKPNDKTPRQWASGVEIPRRPLRSQYKTLASWDRASEQRLLPSTGADGADFYCRLRQQLRAL